MQYITQTTTPSKQHYKSRGGRIGSSSLRRSIEQCEDFTGLEDNVNRYDLLLLGEPPWAYAHGVTPAQAPLVQCLPHPDVEYIS